MADPMDRWLKRIWLVNGVALLALLLFGLGTLAVEAVGSRRSDRRLAIAAPASQEIVADSAGVRAVRFDAPARIRGTTTRIVLVRNGSDYVAEPIGSRAQYGSDEQRPQQGPTANVIFVPADGSAGRLLFDRPAYLRDVSFPGAAYDDDSLRTWITYSGALEDSNRDGRLDEEDDQRLYVSDLEGRDFRPVLSAGWRVQSVEHPTGTQTLLVTALEGPKPGAEWDERRARERAFVYDVPSGRLQPLASLDSLTVKAGRLLGRGGK